MPFNTERVGITEALRAHRRVQLEERRKLAGLWQDQGLVFTSQVGTSLSAQNLRGYFKSLLESVPASKASGFTASDTPAPRSY